MEQFASFNQTNSETYGLWSGDAFCAVKLIISKGVCVHCAWGGASFGETRGAPILQGQGRTKLFVITIKL